MREIKFRAWNLSCEVWREITPTTPFNILHSPNFAIMQFTGLRDKNGKEIYEGDIAIGEHASYLISWDDRMAQFKAKIEKTDKVLLKGNSFPLWQYVDDEVNCRIEVIGNIYENPDLLEKGERVWIRKQ